MDPSRPSYSTNTAPGAYSAAAPPPAASAAPPAYGSSSTAGSTYPPASGPYPTKAGTSSAYPPASGPYPSGAASSYPAASGPYPSYPPASPLLDNRTIVTVERQPGFLDRQKLLIPLMPLWLSIILFVINVILPGVGTMIAGFCAPCTDPGPGVSSRLGSLCANFWIGLAQLLLAPIVIGWVWSIFWGVLFVTQSMDRGSITTTTITPHGRTANISQTRTENLGSGVQVTHTRQGKVVDYGTNTAFGV